MFEQRQACRTSSPWAGLELIAAVAGIKTHASLQTRVGIATGVVVVGDLIGTGAAQEQAVVGETPNFAAEADAAARAARACDAAAAGMNATSVAESRIYATGGVL